MTQRDNSTLDPVLTGQSAADGFDTREVDLEDSLEQLSALIMGALPLGAFLSRVAQSAARSIPGAAGAGVSLLRVDGPHHRFQTHGPSNPIIADIDRLQYDLLNEGPCLTAIAERQITRSGSMDDDARWPRFGPRLGRLGMHSALAIPLTLPDDTVVGSLNVYARGKNAFDDEATRLAEQFAAPAAVAIHNAQVLSLAQERATQLQTALSSRATIDQAIGIIRSRAGGSSEEGFARLRAISQRDNIKLAVVAAQVVDEAVRRAHARQSRS